MQDLVKWEIEQVAGGVNLQNLPGWVQTVGDLLKYLGITQ